MFKWESIFLICWCFMGSGDCYSAESEKKQSDNRNLDFYSHYAETLTKEKEQKQTSGEQNPIAYASSFYPPSFSQQYEPSAPIMEYPPYLNFDDEEITPSSTEYLTKVVPSGQQLQLLAPQTEKEADTYDSMSKQILLLEEQNKYLKQLIELGNSNQKQLNAISEALGLNIETNDRIESNIQSLHEKFSVIKRTMEKDKKSTLYMVYHTIQGGLQLSRAGFGAMATIKTLSLLPAFIIPGWAVYASGIGVGTTMYLLKL